MRRERDVVHADAEWHVMPVLTAAHQHKPDVSVAKNQTQEREQREKRTKTSGRGSLKSERGLKGGRVRPEACASWAQSRADPSRACWTRSTLVHLRALSTGHRIARP
eukprot:1993840-Rhodomonas_salina.3